MVVDWHNTLEKDLQVTPRNLYALEMLADRCQVLVLSYVNSSWRENQELELVSKLPQAHKLMGYQCCWKQVGQDGKVDIACDLNAIAIFDDAKCICQEAEKWGLQVYPIQTETQMHSWHYRQYACFAEAVDAFLKDNFWG